MLIGAHSIVYSKNPEADRAFLRDVLELPNVDVGEGWLIFGLPPAEVAVHPSEENDVHEFYFMCRDVNEFVEAMRDHGIACESVADRGWGLVTQIVLPGGGKLGVYEPRHARPGATQKTSKKASKSKNAKKSNGRAARARRGKAGRSSAKPKARSASRSR